MISKRKPHLLKVKRDIVELVDKEINNLKRLMGAFPIDNENNERTLAIWISQRNRLARDADIPEIPLTRKDGQGKLIYVEE